MIISSLVEAESGSNPPYNDAMKTLRYSKKRERRVPNLKGVHPSVESVMNSAVSYHKLPATWIWNKNTPHCSRLATCHTGIPVSFKSRKFCILFPSLDTGSPPYRCITNHSVSASGTELTAPYDSLATKEAVSLCRYLFSPVVG